jgi:hypothetical protein
MVGSLKKNTTLEYSTRVVQEGDRRCEKSTLYDLAFLTPLRIPLMNPVREGKVEGQHYTSIVPSSMGATVHKLGRKYKPLSECISSL